MAEKLLDVRNLKKYFKNPGGTVFAVDDCSFSIDRGETLGIVGESGCGKTTAGRCVIRLIESTAGEVYFEGRDIFKMGRRELNKARKDMQIIFQDPFSSLNPRRTVYETIAEPIKYQKIMPGATKLDIERRVLQLMETVGLAERLINTYPHELDGGRRQRIGIARALAVEPKFIVCDEPVSALDVSIQAQILNLLKARKDMQIIFQDPFSSLNPRRTVYETIAEPLKYHKIIPGATKRDIERRVLELMETVGLAERLINTYPHELDGGRRQRIGIARALAVEPKFIVCDEPVSALDVSIQAQILNLLKELQRAKGLTFIFITHDLAVVNHFSDNIIVMYLGKEVEKAPAEELFLNPMHPYTKALLSAILIPEAGANKDRITLRGELSMPIEPPDECRFAKRCNYYCEACDKGTPPLLEVSPNHWVACHCIGPDRNTLKLQV